MHQGTLALREDAVARCRSHVLARLGATEVREQPFYHVFIEEIFPADFYTAMRAHMLECKHRETVADRAQDSATFVNRRHSLFASEHDVAADVRAVFTDPEVKLALLRKFYAANCSELVARLVIHEEFEYFFTQAERFQNIHLDIPPKFLSFVFYIPTVPMSAKEVAANATILYDKALQPHRSARFVANSVCIFAPHFYSYHGFATTRSRDAMVLFYVGPGELQRWREVRQNGLDVPPFTGLLDCIEQRLQAYPLIEYARDETKLLRERAACLVNASLGRVLRSGQAAD
jgi:hypothetical protein